MIEYNNRVYTVEVEQIFDGIQIRYFFTNGHGASVVCHSYSYGGREGLFEVSLMDWQRNLTYNDSFPDVVGHLTFTQVGETLDLISSLPIKEWSKQNKIDA